jgi:hypothetical protein
MTAKTNVRNGTTILACCEAFCGAAASFGRKVRPQQPTLVFENSQQLCWFRRVTGSGMVNI